jgi:paraquat-inducible protein A
MQASPGRQEKLLVNLLLILSFVVFGIGLWAPLLTLKKLIFVTNTFSVMSGISQFFQEGQYGLFLLIFVFTLVLPCFKLVVLFTAWNSDYKRVSRQRHLEWLSALGKWSMLDVFIVAILIASVKLGSIASIEVHYGLYIFTAGVILIMVSAHYIHGRLKRPPADQPATKPGNIDNFLP